MQVLCSVCFLSLLWPVTRLPSGLDNGVMNCYMLVIVCQSGYLLQKQLPERENKQKTKKDLRSFYECSLSTFAKRKVSYVSSCDSNWWDALQSCRTHCGAVISEQINGQTCRTVLDTSNREQIVKIAGLFSMPAAGDRSLMKSQNCSRYQQQRTDRSLRLQDCSRCQQQGTDQW